MDEQEIIIIKHRDNLGMLHLYETGEEIIRCKKCRWHTSDDECTHPHWDAEELIMYHSAFENDYCSYGEI